MSILPYWKNLPLSGDEIYYWDCARSIAKGHLLGNFLHPPLWAYALGAVAAVSQDPFAGRLVTVVISSISVAVVYILGRLLYGRKVGLIAGILYSIYPNIVGFSHYLWPESLLSCLVLVAVVLFFRWLRDEKKKRGIYFAFLVLSAGLLVKEFALIAFGAMVVTILASELRDKRQIVLRGCLICFVPVFVYSASASVAAKRPVLLADAFVFNSNEADAGKVVWEHSARENLKVFADRALEIRQMPKRFIGQLLNLWTPSSFPIFRLLRSKEGYREVPGASVIAYVAAGAYVLVIGLGLAGMCFGTKDPFLRFSLTNMILLSSTGLMFMMCSRFRIPFMYIFILYGARALSDFKTMRACLSWRRGLVFATLLVSFAAIILLKRSSFGYWG